MRLVFAPEAQIAYYGGDPDNFEYPRYDLDICLFRVYENGQPAHITDYLKVSIAGPAEHELIFVSGHPGSTSREKTLRTAFRNDPRFQPALSAYDRLESSQAVIARNAKHYDLFEGSDDGSAGFNSKLFQIARTLVRAAAERPKQNGERLPEFQETNRTSLELQLFSEAPIYDDLEKLTLADSLTYRVGQLGLGDPLVQTALAGKSPHDRANELVSGSNLKQDIVGGNSGSPVVNRAGEFVGIVFDGNIQSLVLDYGYTARQGRAVSVDSRAILEALTKVYKSDGLVEELIGSHGGD